MSRPQGTEITGTATHKKEFQDLNHRLSLLLAQQNFLLEASAAASEVDKAGIDNKGLNAFLLQVEEDNRKLVGRQAENDATIAALRKDIALLQKQVEGLRAALTRAQGEATNWKAEAGAALGRVNGLTAEIERLKKELASRVGGSSQMDQVSLNLQREQTEHEKTKQRFANERALLQRDIDALKGQLAEQKQINLSMSATYMADKANFETAQAKCRELQLQIQANQKQTGSWKDDLQREYERLFNKHKQELSDDLERYKASLQHSIKDQIQTITPIELPKSAQSDGYKALVGQLRGQVAKLREDNQQLVLQVAGLTKQMSQLNTDGQELANLKKQKQALEMQMERLRAELAAANDKIRQLQLDHREDIRLKDDEIAALQAQLRDLLGRLQQSQAHAISLKSEFRVYRQMLKEGEHILDVPFPDRKRRRRSSYFSNSQPNLTLSTYCIPLGYIVLHNSTDSAKSLSGWTLKTEDNRHTVQLPSVSVASGSTFKVLTREDNQSRTDLKEDEMLWPVDLSNTSLMLCNRQGNVVSTLPISASTPETGSWSVSSLQNWSWWSSKQ